MMVNVKEQNMERIQEEEEECKFEEEDEFVKREFGNQRDKCFKHLISKSN